jgi:phosphate uptake regulator
MIYLKRLAEIRKQIESLKAEVESIEPDAILEAFEILESNQSPNGKSLVHSDKNAKIVLVLRNRYDDKNISVVRLDEDIDREYEKLCRSNATAIENNQAYIQELQEMIAVAETKQEMFLSSVYLETLRKQRLIALKKTEHKVPSLAVYLK